MWNLIQTYLQSLAPCLESLRPSALEFLRTPPHQLQALNCHPQNQLCPHSGNKI